MVCGFVDVVLVQNDKVTTNKVGKYILLFCAIAIRMTYNWRFTEVLQLTMLLHIYPATELISPDLSCGLELPLVQSHPLEYIWVGLHVAETRTGCHDTHLQHISPTCSSPACPSSHSYRSNQGETALLLVRPVFAAFSVHVVVGTGKTGLLSLTRTDDSSTRRHG
jgi:hypothetical protein